MSGSATSGAVGSRRAPPRRPGRLVSLRARLHSEALDHDLACGIAPWRSPAHGARALQLTAPRSRETCAQGLERVLVESERPRRATRTSAVLLPDPAVMLCAPLIWAIVDELRGPGPVSAEGMARLRTLLCDGAGPLYAPGRLDELQQALQHVSRWLPVAS